MNRAPTGSALEEGTINRAPTSNVRVVMRLRRD